MNAREIAAQMQLLYQAALSPLIEQGSALIQSLPPKQPTLAKTVFDSTAERLFLFLRDAGESFLTRLDTGYLTTAALTRSLMETATVLVVFARDTTATTLSAFVAKAEKDSRKRRDGLARLRTATDSYVASAAQNETTIAEKVLQSLKAIHAGSTLPSTPNHFPDMAERCRRLGENWQFLYHAVYRDLCDAVHGAFLKIPHTPSVAFQSSNQGDTVLFEHCRTFGYAVEFWGVTVLECCSDHPDKDALSRFRHELESLIVRDASLSAQFPPTARHHTISF